MGSSREARSLLCWRVASEKKKQPNESLPDIGRSRGFSFCTIVLRNGRIYRRRVSYIQITRVSVAVLCSLKKKNRRSQRVLWGVVNFVNSSGYRRLRLPGLVLCYRSKGDYPSLRRFGATICGGDYTDLRSVPVWCNR